MRLRRSIAWVSGTDFNKCVDLIQSEADAICIDLEDFVMPADKSLARKVVLKMLKTLDFQGKERIIRINDATTGFYSDDLNEVIAKALPDAIRLPKCETAADVLNLDKNLKIIEAEAGVQPNSIEIIAMIESPLGIINAYEIAHACPRVTAISIGMEDLTTEMEIERRYLIGNLDLLYARQKFVLAGKAAKVQVIDSGFNKNSTLEFNEAYNKESYQMGFDGRSVANNEQAVTANNIYRPTEEKIAWAVKVIKAYEAPETNPNYVFIDGIHLCAATYAKAKNITEKAAAIALKEQSKDNLIKKIIQ